MTGIPELDELIAAHARELEIARARCDALVAAERERCARIVAPPGKTVSDTRQHLADQIRSGR